MKNYLLKKIGGFTILAMVTFVLVAPIALAKPKPFAIESISELRKAISGLDAQYILVCDNGRGSFEGASIYAPDSKNTTYDSQISLLFEDTRSREIVTAGHVFLVNLMMSYGWQPLGGVSGTGYGDLPICQAMIKE